MDTRKFRLAGACAIAIVLPLLIAATSGGFPSRPRFQSVGIGVAAPSQSRLTIRGDAANPSLADIQFQNNAGTATGRIGDTNSADTDIYVEALSGNSSIRLVPAGSGATLLSGDFASFDRAILRGATTGNANNAYLRFQDSAGTSMGFVGDASSSNSDLYLTASTAAANINLNPGAGGNVLITGTAIPRTAFTSVTGGTGALLAPTVGVSGAVRNSVGNYTVTFSTAFTTAACVATTRQAGNNEVLSVGNATTTTLVTAVDGSTSANTDVTFTVMCVGT